MRIAFDSWDSKTAHPVCLQGTLLEYDKLQHLAGGILMGPLCALLGVPGLLLAMILAVVWEVKDAFVGYEEYGAWGGDGFSWRDLVATWAGSIGGWGVCVMVSSLLC